MRTILSTNGYTILVDSHLVEELSKYNWLVNKLGYAQTKTGTKQVTTYIHKLVAKLENFPEFKEIDHIDRNKLNNQASNLRPATRSQNMANRSKRSGYSSSYKGVSYDRFTSKWRAQLKVNNKHVLAKRFATEIEAAKAYDKAAFEAWGEFATLNFPEDYQ